jgi:hypothetical protein
MDKRLIRRLKACLNKSERSHLDALDAADEGGSDHLETVMKMKAAVTTARAHADDAYECGRLLDGDDDNELGLPALARKRPLGAPWVIKREAAAIAREAEEIARRGEEIDAFIALKFPAPPESWRDIDPDRQAVAIIHDQRELGNGDRLLISGAELSDYFTLGRGVEIDHDPNRLAAHCLDIQVIGDQMIGLAQFPKKGLPGVSDRCFAALQRGELSCASVAIDVLDRSIGGSEITKWNLREWSFCDRGANAACKVLSVGGVEMLSGRRAWNDPHAPRRPTADEAGPGNYWQALDRYKVLEAAAQWRS